MIRLKNKLSNTDLVKKILYRLFLNWQRNIIGFQKILKHQILSKHANRWIKKIITLNNV